MSTESKDILKPEHWDSIMRMMGGAGMLGAGTAGLVALGKYLKGLKDDRKREEELDDDILYVYRDRDQVKSAAAEDDDSGAFSSPLSSSWKLVKNLGSSLFDSAGDAVDKLGEEAKEVLGNPMAIGLGIPGMAIAGTGGYMLVKKLAAELEKRKVKKDLERAQRLFLDAQGYKEMKKQAEAGEYSGADMLAGGAIALPLLLALTAGVSTNSYLDRQYPVKKKLPKAPRRIEVIDKPIDEQQEELDALARGKDPYEKEASTREFVLHMLDAADQKNSDIKNLVHAVAGGGLNEFKKAADAMGFVDALNLVKGASAVPVDPAMKHLAITYLARSPQFGPQVGVVAAGEFAEAFPSMYKTAAFLPEHQKEALYGVASLLGPAIRVERAYDLGIVNEQAVKRAAAVQPTNPADPNESLERVLMAQATNSPMKPSTDGGASTSTATSGEELGINDPDSPSRPKSMEQISGNGVDNPLSDGATGEVDPIDNFFSPKVPTKTPQQQF